MRKGHIFDMDGTLLDSMRFWRSLGRIYLRRLGIEAPESLDAVLRPMTVDQAAEYLREIFGLRQTPRQICREIEEMIEALYVRCGQLKPGAADYLRKLKSEGALMAVLTATPRGLAEPVLERLGILGDFQFVMDCSGGRHKRTPEIFLDAAARLDVLPGEAEVYEDSLYAVRAARAGGFFVTAVEDPWSAPDAEQLRQLSDRYIRSWAELL